MSQIRITATVIRVDIGHVIIISQGADTSICLLHFLLHDHAIYNCHETNEKDMYNPLFVGFVDEMIVR